MSWSAPDDPLFKRTLPRRYAKQSVDLPHRRHLLSAIKEASNPPTSKREGQRRAWRRRKGRVPRGRWVQRESDRWRSLPFYLRGDIEDVEERSLGTQ